MVILLTLVLATFDERPYTEQSNCSYLRHSYGTTHMAQSFDLEYLILVKINNFCAINILCMCVHFI